MAERERTTLDGVRVFDGRDKFLPGKIAIGLSYLLVGNDGGEAKRARLVRGYREIADLTVGMDNETWGIYYYLLALNRLKRAGLLEEAVAPEAPAPRRRRADRRTSSTATDSQ